MTDPFLAFERNPDSEEAEKILAAGFDWSELERRLESDTDPEEVIAQARAEGNMEMLSKILAICAEGVMDIRQVSKRSGVIGSRLLCAAAILHPGQAIEARVSAICEATGLKRTEAFRRMAEVRKRMG